MVSHHIVMFPFMTQSHIIPFLALAKLIEQRWPSYTITIVNTPHNIENLQPSLPHNSNIRLEPLPLDIADYGLVSDNTDSLPCHRIIKASESLEPHFDRLCSDIARRDARPPLCIISDVFQGWTAQVARKLGIYHATFSTCGAYGTAAWFSLWLHLPHAHTDDDYFCIPGFPDTFRLHRSQLSFNFRDADELDVWSPTLQKLIGLIPRSSAMLCNTVEALEPMGLQLLHRTTGLPVWSVGPLLPLDNKANSSLQLAAGKKPSGKDMEACLTMLDSHPTSSVLYVSFGSEGTISPAQMMALAMGLEASGKPFIWVVRPPLGFDLKEGFRDEWLPEGFEARMARRGLLVKAWAPQLEILSHGSTGAFLSHCGWNSVLESLSWGVPVIGWPLASEQFYNSKMLEEVLGVGVELARGVEVNVAHREVERVVRLVMGGGSKKGEEMAEKAARCRDMIREAMIDDEEEEVLKGSSIRNIEGFIHEAIRSMC